MEKSILIITLILLFICFLSIAECVKGSFYGASHIAMPLQEAKLSTNIRLKFRTQQENALILLAAGRTDYCLLSLDSGRITFYFKVDDYLAELWSPKKLTFNDLQWHDIAIHRYDTNITMQIDEHFIRKTVPARVAELNIHFGVFLGGYGDFSESYLSSIDNFRGCISDVYYNNINVLKRAKERTSHVSSVQVSWVCSSEFDANEHQSISFVENDAYVMIAKPVVQTGESWNLELRTIETLATVLYNCGSDFVGLEIVNGKLRLLVSKGSNAVELFSDNNISDGKWHNISLNYSPTIVQLIIDEKSYMAQFANGSVNVIELDEEYFIGGLMELKKKKALSKGLRAVEQNFRGCLRNIHIDKQMIGFPHMKVTHGVTTDCIWNYPCIMEKSPCILSSVCQQYGVEEFICYCEQAYCIRADYTDKYKIFTRTDLPTEIEILAVSPIQILEGDSIFLSTAFIDVLVDYTKLNIMEAGVVFHIVQPPKHGKISILPLPTNVQNNNNNSNNETNSKFFSLIDLSTDKVKYTHNGHEQFSDHITIDLQLMSGGNNREPIPEFLQGKHRFVLHVNVTPVNDAPVLRIPNNRILRLTQGIPKIITSDLLSVEDPDSSVNAIMYSILNMDNEFVKKGKLEVKGKVATVFSQADINDGVVTYLMNSQATDDTSFELIFQVSDGMETSSTVNLPVSILPLQLRMINNTGLILVHKSAALITPWNLSFISNSDDDNVDVKYNIVQAPQFGNVQKLRAVDSSWITVDSFTTNQILLGHIRYIHNIEFPIHDEFKFTATFGPIRTIKYDFRITFTKLKIGIQLQNSLHINGTLETIITQNNLFHQTTPLPTYSRNIIYTVLIAPKYGLIYVDGHPEYAKPMDSFTQYDIDKNLIRYRTHHKCYSSFADDFKFLITVPECDDVEGSIKIIYNPLESLSRTLSYQTREKIYVDEGERSLLTRKNFQVLFNKFDYLIFKISIAPKHGKLCQSSIVENVSGDATTNNNQEILTFTLENLYLDDIYYCHDNSESTKDSLQFLILSDYERDFQFICEILVEITLRNDNEPIRMSNNVLHVVRNDSKIINNAILKYVDPDINTNESYISYTQLSTTNGEFFKAGVLTNYFTQEDIDLGKIMFKHIESDEGKASFIVTDGYYKVPGILEIQASDPFIKISEKNASIVQEGKYVLIRNDELSIESNLNSKPDEIEYNILDGPNYGALKILRRKFNGTVLSRTTNITTIKNFTQLDIDKERLVYWNTDVASMDKIRYRVSTKGIWAEGEILIRIYPAAYWDLLQIRRNQTLYVEESTSVTISRDVLEIVHPNISPGDITYLVTTSPQHGYLEIQSITSDDEYNCKVFDQSTVNAEKMFYIQAGVNQSTDHFIFDVTNGITWLRGLLLKIVIIPEHLYIQTRNVSVEEGKTIKLEPNDMLPYSEYYIGKILEYKIVQQPTFGHIKSGKSKINRFTYKQLEAGNIHYSHDGSENATDTIRLMGISKNKESIPFDLIISIIPINDEIPQIVTNTGLQMWNGGRGVLKKIDLMAQDYDTPPEHLTFLITYISGGFIAYNDITPAIVTNFTQYEINTEKVYFYHEPNHLNAHIKFIVTDGVHNSSEQILQIVTNPVTLELIKNENLHVFPLTRKQILADQLNFRCSDTDRDVKFLITIPPQTGRILYEHLENGTTNEIKEFTQNDINMGRILYEHTHSMIELKSNDSFYFDVSAKLSNSLLDQIFNIEISVSSGGLLRFLRVQKLHLDEGAMKPIHLDLSQILEYLEARAKIQSPELYIDVYPPMYGTIEFDDIKRNLTRFSLNDFINEKIFYHHDHSDTIEDVIAMSVYLVQGQIFLCNLTIPVIINPVNDHPFYLKTQSPQMSIVEGENCTITEQELLTVDDDTEPNNIVYEIISSPTLGALIKMHNNNNNNNNEQYEILKPKQTFSQSDINENRIKYIHYGMPQSTTFYFKVSDGKFNPAYDIFNLKILPIIVGPGHKNEIVMVQQGTNMALIESKHFPIETNVNYNRLAYNITQQPLNGVILLENKPTSMFNHNQLEDHQISYMQTDLTKSNDSFKVTAYVTNTIYSIMLEVKIIVEPYIKINGISIISGDKIRLTSSFIMDNPTQLKINKYNPKIVITKRPDHGKIRKIIRNSGATENLNDKNVNSFTYKELKSGVVYFVARNLPEDGMAPLNDYFEYILYIESIQPGQGFVSIEIHKINKNAINDNDTIDVISQQAFSMNYIVIIVMIVLMFIIIIITVVFFKNQSSTRMKNDPDKDYPPPLPRPPDFMSLNNNLHMQNNNNNNNRIYSSSDGDSIPVTASSTPLPVLSSIPHCKVIPIGGLDDSESDDMIDMNIDSQHISGMGGGGGGGIGGRYPYGEENDEWSSSIGGDNNNVGGGNEVSYSSIAQPQQQLNSQQQRNNPLLRRNQYWV